MVNWRDRDTRPWLTCLKPQHLVEGVVYMTPFSTVAIAVVNWLEDPDTHCDIIHSHEWGGVFTYATLHTRLRLNRPGTRYAVQLHGGHMWSFPGKCALRAITAVELGNMWM